MEFDSFFAKAKLKIDKNIYKEINKNNYLNIKLKKDNVVEYTQKLMEYEQKLKSGYYYQKELPNDCQNAIEIAEELKNKLYEYNTINTETQEAEIKLKNEVDEYIKNYVIPLEQEKEQVLDLNQKVTLPVPYKQQNLYRRFITNLTRNGREQKKLSKKLEKSKVKVQEMTKNLSSNPFKFSESLNDNEKTLASKIPITTNFLLTEEMGKYVKKSIKINATQIKSEAKEKIKMELKELKEFPYIQELRTIPFDAITQQESEKIIENFKQKIQQKKEEFEQEKDLNEENLSKKNQETIEQEIEEQLAEISMILTAQDIIQLKENIKKLRQDQGYKLIKKLEKGEITPEEIINQAIGEENLDQKIQENLDQMLTN